MQILSSLPYKLTPLDTTVDPAAPEIAFIVKGTFAPKPGAACEPVDAGEQKEFSGDVVHMDKIGRSLRYASDLAPFKPFGEVLVTANAHAPDRRPTTSVEVGLVIGPIAKRLRVHGDRVWLRDPQGEFFIEGPMPFVEMPLRWERAFGGLDNRQNPLGRGLEPWLEEDGRKHFFLANIEDPQNPLRGKDHSPEPAGFAPIAPHWEPRASREGTRDRHWAAFIAPLPPRDFDPRAAQAAPADQWLKDYWRGDETFKLVNMHPEHPEFLGALPGKRLRLFIEIQLDPAAAPGTAGFAEVPLDLDTVHIDMTAERLHLVWRKHIKVSAAGAPEIAFAYLAEEPLADEPWPLARHHADFLQLKPPSPEDERAGLARDEQTALAEARKALAEAKIDPGFLALFDAAPDSQARFALVLDLMRTKTAELDALVAVRKAA